MKPCPKCKSESTHISRSFSVLRDTDTFTVRCLLCAFTGPTEDSIDEAAASWDALQHPEIQPEPIPAPFGGKAPSQFLTFQNVRYDANKTIVNNLPILFHTTYEFNPEGVYTKPVKIRRLDVASIVPGSIRDNAGFGYDEEDEKTMSYIRVKGISIGYLVMGTVDEVEEMLR